MLKQKCITRKYCSKLFDPEILNVKEYTYDELNDNIDFSDSDELKIQRYLRY